MTFDERTLVSEFASGDMEMVEDDDAAGEATSGGSGGFFGWLMSLFGFGFVMGAAAMKLKGFYNVDA